MVCGWCVRSGNSVIIAAIGEEARYEELEKVARFQTKQRSQMLFYECEYVMIIIDLASQVS